MKIKPYGKYYSVNEGYANLFHQPVRDYLTYVKDPNTGKLGVWDQKRCHHHVLYVLHIVVIIEDKAFLGLRLTELARKMISEF